MENEETAIMKFGGKPILNLELLWSFREHINMLFKCPLKAFQLRGHSNGTFTWPLKLPNYQ